MWKLGCIVLISACTHEPRSAGARTDPKSATALAAREFDYPAIRKNLDAQRAALSKTLRADRIGTLSRARMALVTTLRDELLPAWNGTSWAMNGTSVVPHEGEIACGYFVSTILLHAGFALERARLGQQASEHITRTLVTTEPIWHSSKQPSDQFVARLRRSGDGIYLVGLDFHVGFVIVDGNDTWFHHPGPTHGVEREPALTAPFLSSSQYREAAKLFDDALVEKWLLGTAIKTVLPKPRTATPPA
jgi:hypothetical protein